ncbi:hypothetical protein CC80DRAFT_494457 [Byssothecium circinans]|uniref:Brl1/Brr6 domain-containing protein n=1 Tax=Byssothecium circinans TaxID=147558 RepID=A0A6A5TPE5_9PLEO|nr:hypothetical protein CC80DRAFT_494457 [Byssothecium circinans]
MSRHRQSTTPMDFEWDNSTGRVDTNSPWITAQQQQSAKKRTHSVLDSPSKNPFTTPNRPQLREANGQHYLFSSGQRPLPSIPAHVSAWEPRTPQSVVDFSSGGETPNTPAQDSDAATPDTQLASRMGSLSHGGEKGQRKSKRESIMNFFGRSSPSPNKDERDREREKRAYSKKAENRVMKRRSKRSKHAIAEDYDSDNEPGGMRNNTTLVEQPRPAIGILASIPGVLSWVEAHPHLPMVLSYYMQFIVNAILGLTFLYIIYSALSAIINDVNFEASLMENEIRHQIALCFDDYNKNRCGSNPPPALVNLCQEWLYCTQKDVKRIARASVGAKAGAKILNSFTEEFSYKSMLFTAIVLFGGFNLSNWAFNRIRKEQPYPAQQHQHQQQIFDYPPATPQRQLSGGYAGMIDQQNGWQTPTPYGTPYAGSVHRPLLQHASQSLPVLPGGSAEDVGVGDAGTVRGSPVKKGWIGRR